MGRRYGTRSVTKQAGGRAGAVVFSPALTSSISSIVNHNHRRRGDDDEPHQSAHLVNNKNRMLLVQLEQLGILAPGVVTIDDATGALQADLSREEEPDRGTMAGLFPNQSTTDTDEQIPSWLRDYLVQELDVYGCGPPAACAALYEHLRRSQDDVGLNTSVRTAATLLRCAATSLRHALQDIREFVDADCMVADTYALEVGMVARTVGRLVGSGVATAVRCREEDEEEDDDEYEDKGKKKTPPEKRTIPREIQLLLDIGGMGVAMKKAVETSLTDLVVEPYSRLVDKLDMIAKGLQREEEGQQQQQQDSKQQAEQDKSETNESHSGSDSGIDGC